MYVIARPLLDHTMPGSKLHSTVQRKEQLNSPLAVASRVWQLYFYMQGHCTPATLPLMPVKVFCEQGTVNLFISGSALFFL